MLHMGDNRKKIIGTGLKYLLEFVFILAGLLLLGTVGTRGIQNMKIYQQIFPDYLELSAVVESEDNLEWDGNNLITGEAGYFVMQVTADRILDIRVDLVNRDSLQGYIWYSQSDAFEEEPTAYTFFNGHNTVQVENGIQYIKVMFTGEPGVPVQNLRISYRNPFELYAKTHKKQLFGYTLALWLIGIGLSACSFYAKGRYRKIVMTGAFFMIVGITALFVFRDYIFGQKAFVYRDIGGDTIQQYYPYYLNCVRRIQEGNFGIWNWEYGLGTSLINNISQTLDPFGIFVILGGVVFGIGKVRYLLVVAQILKIFIAAGLCRYFLKQFKVSERAACIGAYLYAFNGYLMLWGQHYLLGTTSIYILLVLIFLEKLIREKKMRYIAGLSVSVALSTLSSYYNTYMLLLFGAIYCVIRLLSPNESWNIKERVKKACNCLVSVVLGLMMGAVTLLPVVSYLTGSSSRLASDTTAVSRFLGGLFSSFDRSLNFQTVGRLISNNLFYVNQISPGGWGNYYEMPNVCISIFLFLFLGQLLFLSVKRCRNKKQFAYGILIAVVGISILFNPGMSIAFNAFACVQMRHTFVVMPILALLVAVVWDRAVERKEFSVSGLILGTAVSMAVLYGTYHQASGEVRNYNIQVGILILVFAALLVGIWKWKAARGILIQLTCLCIVLSTIMEVNITTNQRTMLHRFNEGMDYSSGKMDNDTMRALSYLEESDSSFYRVDKTYVDLSTWGDSVMEGYSAVTDYNSTINYNLASFTDELYSASRYSTANRIFLNSKEEDIYPLGLINLKYILSKEELDWTGFDFVNKIESVYIYRNTKAESAASFYTKTISKTQCEGMEESQRQKLLEDTVIVEDENDLYHGGGQNAAQLGTFYADNSRVWGTVRNEQKGLLVLTIPDQNGWEVYVDGSRQETLNADYGFKAVMLEPGEHEIEAVYHIPYLKEGAIISVIGILGLTAVLLYMRRQKNKTEIKGVSNE